MYSKYDAALLNEGNIDFGNYVVKFGEAGNAPGIYSDVALLLYRLVASEHVNSILEFGSGMSTCILSRAAHDHSKKYNSMEHLRKWFDITTRCMVSLGIPIGNYVCTDSLPVNFSKIDSPVDVVFVDGPIAYDQTSDPNKNYRLEACTIYGEWLRNAVFVFDDAQNMNGIQPWLRAFGRGEELEVWFNPTGRLDRHQIVSFPTVGHPLRALVDACRL